MPSKLLKYLLGSLKRAWNSPHVIVIGDAVSNRCDCAQILWIALSQGQANSITVTISPSNAVVCQLYSVGLKRFSYFQLCPAAIVAGTEVKATFCATARANKGAAANSDRSESMLIFACATSEVGRLYG